VIGGRKGWEERKGLIYGKPNETMVHLFTVSLLIVAIVGIKTTTVMKRKRARNR